MTKVEKIAKYFIYLSNNRKERYSSNKKLHKRLYTMLKHGH